MQVLHSCYGQISSCGQTRTLRRPRQSPACSRPQQTQQSKTEKLLSYGAAKVIATTALETCQAKGLRVSATVVNRGDDAILQLPGDAARPQTAENSGRKAYTESTVRTEYRRLR
jgi:hypothetical protein